MTTLVVEDNPMDVRMIRFALKEAQWDTDVVVADDGEKACHYLLQQDPYSEAARPGLLILDLNLPKRNGSEVLKLVRTTETLQHLPVVILSSSPGDVIRDIVNRTNLSAQLLLTKPSNVTDYLALGHLFRRCFEEHEETYGAGGSTL